jgi:glycerol-3-phosphate dehydrogenase
MFEDYSQNNKQLRLTKGVHLVLDQSVFPLRQAVYFDTSDGRMVFAVPRDGKTYVGTTDTFFDKEIASPKMTAEDRDYLLQAIRFMFPDVEISSEDVESSWAGVRPLIFEEGKDPSEISRKDEIWDAESGLITIAGGKLTGYRKMAEAVVDLVADRLKKQNQKWLHKKSKTKSYRISGGKVGGSKGLKPFIANKEKAAVKYGFNEEEGHQLASMYGSNVDELFKYGRQYDQRTCKLSRIVYAQLLYAIEQEMATNPGDYFIRRTGALFFQIEWVQRWKDEVIVFMAKKLGWTQKQTDEHKAQLEKELNDAVTPADV